MNCEKPMVNPFDPEKDDLPFDEEDDVRFVG